MASDAAAPRRGDLLHHRDFRPLWAGQTTSDVGTAGSVVPVVIPVASPLRRMRDLPDAPPTDRTLPENAAAMPHT